MYGSVHGMVVTCAYRSLDIHNVSDIDLVKEVATTGKVCRDIYITVVLCFHNAVRVIGTVEIL